MPGKTISIKLSAEELALADELKKLTRITSYADLVRHALGNLKLQYRGNTGPVSK